MKKNINEEIVRIKSLFTEERLYGNLIVEEEETENEEGDGEEKDPFSKDAVKQGKKDAKTDNTTKNIASKKAGKVALEACNTSLKRYHQSFFNVNPVKRRDVIKVIGTEGKYKTELESCVTNYKDKLHVPGFAGMTKDEILDMLLVMLDPKGDKKEREKYKTVTVEDSIVGTKPTTTITTKKPEQIIDANGATWGSVQILKNKENEFVIKTGKKTRVEAGMSWRGSIIKSKKFIPALIKSIKKINPTLTPTDYKNLKILNARGETGQTIKILVK
tara:strand:+ start:1465 stop:2286 length:822 start_codon:yes stop_codon:yes gene_type:complete